MSDSPEMKALMVKALAQSLAMAKPNSITIESAPPK
jgi:hypothetical protein